MLQILYIELNCNDQSMLKMIYLIKSILNIVSIVIPILLIIWCLLDGLRNMMSQNGWEHKIIKKMLNRFIAAVCVFLIPTILNIVLGFVGENGYQVGTCWQEATKEGIEAAEEPDTGFSKNIIEAGEAVIELRKELFKNG